MPGQTRVEEMSTPELKQDCGCGCGGADCATAAHDCGCGCGGTACGTVTQEMTFVGVLPDRRPDTSNSSLCTCDGSCGCRG